MKTKSNKPQFHLCLPRLRLAAAGILFVAAAALATSAMMRIKLPWAAPVVSVGANPVGAAVDLATDTIYVANTSDNTISVIDGNYCDASDRSNCLPIATMTNVGFGPVMPVFDPTTLTLYVTNALTESGDDGNTVAVLDVANCNAHDTSGCARMPAAVITVSGSTGGFTPIMALDSALHTLYIGDGFDGPISMVDTDSCNASETSGCDHVLTATAAGLSVQIDPSNQSVYVANTTIFDVTVFNAATCNAVTQSDCSTVSVAQLPDNFIPLVPGIDSTTHSLYVPLIANPDVIGEVLGYTAVIDGSTCNSSDHSGCGQTPRLVQSGNSPQQAMVDQTTETVYVLNWGSASLSVIDAATCNGKDPGGCPTRVPALATGFESILFALNPATHTIYQPTGLTNNVWVLDSSQCNARHLDGCTKFARVTPVGGTPVGLKENPDTHSLYVANAGNGNTGKTVSIIDTTQCNQSHPEGCHEHWPEVKVGAAPRFVGVNRSTNTVYASLLGTNRVAVIDGSTCNSSTTSGCALLSHTPVGHQPQQIAIDEETNTIYVVNQGDNTFPSTMSIIDGTHCNGTDTSGCHQSWPVAPVGVSPQGLTFNPDDHTIYVTNTNDNTVSVIDTSHCHAGDSSGCAPVATFPVGAGPRAAGVVRDTNTLFVANRDDLSVSVIDGARCNGSNTSGCPQTAPPAIVVGAFPETAGADVQNVVGRSVTIDQKRHTLLLPVSGDSDVVMLDGNTCTASNVNGCRPKVIPRRMGGFALCAEVSETTGTVYVTNNADATVSVFPEPR